MDTGYCYRSCPVCGSGERDPYWHWFGLTVIQCKRCRAVYAEAAQASYTANGSLAHLGEGLLLPWRGFDVAQGPDEVADEVRIFRRYCPEGRILVVGSANSPFAAALMSQPEYALTVTGVERVRHPRAADHDYLGWSRECHYGLDVRVPFLDASFQGAPYDAITFWSLFDRLAQARLFLRQAESVLRPGALCLVSVSNLKSLAVRILGKRHPGFRPSRANYFTPRTLRNLAATTPALDLIALHSLGFDRNSIWNGLRKRQDGTCSSSEEQSKAGSGSQPPAWMRWVLDTLNLGDRIIMVLRKS